MNIEITGEYAKEKHPELVAEVNPKAKYYYEWTVTGTSVKFEDIFKPKPVQTMEQKIEDMIKRTTVYLNVQIGRKKGHSFLLNPVPELIVNQIKERFQREEERKKEFEAMSPEERQRSILRTATELQKMGGFVAIKSS